MWGLLPAYWKLISGVSPFFIICCRIVFSLVFALIILSFSKKWGELWATLKVRKNYKWIVLSGLLITANWTIYVWAVNSGHILDSSLGYYMNPLFAVFAASFFFGEKISGAQKFALGLAALGVLALTFWIGVFPWVSICLALTFASYGVCKKKLGVSASVSFTLETAVGLPIALVVGTLLTNQGQNGFVGADTTTILLLVGSGIVTSIPLILYADGVAHIPFNIMGILQYVSPTLMLILGVTVYGESFTAVHGITFGLIWIGVIIYLSSINKRPIRAEAHTPLRLYPEQYDLHTLFVPEVFKLPKLDKNYKFVPNSWWIIALRAVLRFTILPIFFLLLKLVTGAKVYNRGILKKYKNELKDGAVTICNHVHLFDYVCVLLAIRPRMEYSPSWFGNARGQNWPLIRLAGGIPVPEDLAGLREFHKAIAWVLENKKWFHVYPETAMWDFYQAIRPFKPGTFKLAEKYEKPIVPLVINYRNPKGIEKLFCKKPRLNISVCEPVLPGTGWENALKTARAEMIETAGFDTIIEQDVIY